VSMALGAFLRRRRDRIINAVLNLAPGPIARTLDQARSRKRHEELAARLDTLIAELETERAAAKDEHERQEIEDLFSRLDELHARTRPMTRREQRVADEDRRRRDRSDRIAAGDDGPF
jgi:hypothetical protein